MSMPAKPLIIAEKPSAARAIAEALGGFSRREGYLESPEFYLSWAIGHLVELMPPEEYEARWKRWSLESLPILPQTFGLKVVAKTKPQFSILAKLAKAAPELINACDAAREGELIFRYICQAADVRRPVRRLWVSALTKESIRKAFAGLKPEAEYDRLYQSALCRAQGDWLVGMNATRAFSVKWGELYSVGRVQTPTLALLVRREREIAAFVPEDYWEVFADFGTPDSRRYRGKWFGPDGDQGANSEGTASLAPLGFAPQMRFKKAEEAEAVAARVQGQPGQVESVEEKPASERPPQLYDLTTLQREANRRFGLTAAATLKSAQNLYEAKLITYPRTDSRYLNRDLLPGLPAVVRAAGALAEFRQAAAGADLGLVHPGNRRVIDDTKVSDHHAIIPTTERPSGLSAVEAKLYGLIVRRFLSQFYPEAKFLDTEVITRVGGQPDRFKSRGRRVLDPGWHAVEAPLAPAKGDEEDAEAAALPPLHQGEGVKVDAAEVKAKRTQPPRRYTEATLLSAMEFAGKVMDDEALKEAMKGRGLGTPATRASIIERLKTVGYIDVEKKALLPTPKGHQLVALAEQAGAQVLLSPELTGEWEKRIADIQAGAYQSGRFMAEIRDLASQVVELTRRAAGVTGGGSAGVAGGARGGTAAEGGAATRRTARGSRSTTAAHAEPTAADALPANAGQCPRCGRTVVRSSRAWTCANHDCTLSIPTWLCGQVIDGTLATALLTKGRTKLITGFKSPRTGKTFSAYLLLKEGKVAFEFPADKPSKSGYRRSNAGGTTVERAPAKKTGPRAAGSSTAGAAPKRASRPAGAGVVGRKPRASQPAGTRPERD